MPTKSKSAPKRRRSRAKTDLELKSFVLECYGVSGDVQIDIQIEGLDKIAAWLKTPILLGKPKLEIVAGTATAKGQR